MKRIALILFLGLTICSARTPFGPFMGVGAVGFTPATHKFLTGSGTETVPVGSTQLTLEVWAGGAGGNVSIAGGGSRGGSSGSYGKRIFAVAAADWNKPIAWVVGNGGAGCGPASSCSGTDGNNSTVGSGSTALNGVTLNIVTNKGLHSGSAPSAGTGGTTNTAGNASVAQTAGAAIVGLDSDAAGAGGDGTLRSPEDATDSSASGSNGMAKFKWE